MDIDKLKKFEKLPPDVKRQLALYMAKWKDMNRIAFSYDNDRPI